MRSVFVLLIAMVVLQSTETAMAAQRAYIAHGSNVSVIDTENEAINATIGGLDTGFAIAVHSATQRAYLPRLFEDRIDVLDTQQAILLEPLLVPVGYARSIAMSPTGNRAYVADQNGLMRIIDVSSRPATVIAQVPVGTWLYAMVVHPDGKTIYAGACQDSCTAMGMISIISTTAPYASTTRFVGIYPQGLALNSDGSRLYVAGVSVLDPDHNAISILDTTTLEVEEVPINTARGARAVAVHPDNNRIYVINGCSASSCTNAVVTVMAGTPLAEIANIPVGFLPDSINVHPDGSRVYVVNPCIARDQCEAGSTVSIIDTLTNTVVKTIPVGHFSHAVGQFFTRPIADLAVAASSANPSRRVGQTAHFTVGIDNAGPDDSVATHLGLTLDAATEGMSISPPIGWICTSPVLSATATTTTCSSNQLANNASPTFNVSVLLGDELEGKTLTLTANVSSVSEDIVPGDNRDSASVQVVADANLMMSVVRQSGSLRSEVEVPVVFRLDNHGPNAAVDARAVFTSNLPSSAITLTAPPAWNCIAASSATAGIECFRDGTLASGERVNFSLRVTAPVSMAGKYLVVNGTSSSDTPDPGLGNNQAAFKAMVRPVANAIPVMPPLW